MLGFIRDLLQPGQSGDQDQARDAPGGQRDVRQDALGNGAVAGGLTAGARGASDESGLNAWGQGAVATQVSLPEGLSEEQVAAAQAWATSSEGPGANITRQLQAQLGVPATGSYDRATVVAVFRDQRARNVRGTAGVANASYMSGLGLLFTQDVVGASVEDALLADLQANHPGGFTTAFYVHYDNQSNNNKEFERQATPYAAQHGALGLQSGSIVAGAPIAITETSEVVEGLRSIHQGLLERFAASAPRFVQDLLDTMQGAGMEGLGPNWTKARDVALFSHGMPGGLSTDSGNNYRDGLHGDTYGPSNIESFVRGIRGATTSDVNVQLFACGAGRGTDENEAWLEHRQDHKMGQNSVAAELSTHLGEDASVFAHTTTGHTTENYAARVFGAEGGGGQGGLHMFDRLYPESFIQSELARIYPSRDQAWRDGQHNALRERMWRHYRTSIGNSVPDSRYGGPMGQLMFQDPSNAAQLLQRDWQAANAPQ